MHELLLFQLWLAYKSPLSGEVAEVRGLAGRANHPLGEKRTDRLHDRFGYL